MTKLYHQIRDFAGLSNHSGIKGDGNGLYKAQNISLDKKGLIRTIGGLEAHGATGLATHAAILCPGAGLFPYGSDHWRGTDTVVDLLSQANAASDHDPDNDGPNVTTGWSNIEILGTATFSAELDEVDGIASNGTTNILKSVGTAANFLVYYFQSITTVVGQSYIFSVDLYDTGLDTGIFIAAGTTQGGEQHGLVAANVTGAWGSRTLLFKATGTTTYIKVMVVGLTGEIGYFDDAYLSAIPQPDLDTTWLALADVANAQLDLYNGRDNSFTANLLDFGTVASYTATVDTINFPTSNTLTDSTGQFLNASIKEGKVYKISGCSTTTANNVIFVVDRVIAGTIYARGNPFTITADENGTVVLTEYNPVDFNFTDDSLNASPVGGGIALRPKQYRFVDRIHFEGTLSSETKYQDWYLNDIGLAPPTDIAFDAAVDSGVSGDLGAGLGWELGMTVTADGGEWPAGTYIIACSHLYNDGQESELRIVDSNDADMPITAITDNASLTLSAKATGPYNERISGGRIYTRIDETDGPWILLLDISITEGARATLSGGYNGWIVGATTATSYTASGVSKQQNADTYEGLTGFSPDAKMEKFVDNNRYYDASVIAGNRTFLFGPRYKDDGGKIVHFRDRIIYSKINEHDVFPIGNFIDVVGSDAEDYVAGAVYGSDLLCFKQNTLYIIDITDPLRFVIKQDQKKGKYPFRGISRPAAMFETPHGLAWVNRYGMWLYNGAEIIDLLGDKIERSKFPLKHERYVDFDGVDDKVDMAAGIANLGNGNSAVIRFRRHSAGITAGDEMLIGNATGTADRFNVSFLTGTTTISVGYFDGATHTRKSGTVADTDWHTLISTYDGDVTMTLELDGVVLTGSVAPSGTQPTDSFNIGSASNGNNNFNGDIERVDIYNRVLSSDERAAIFAGGEIAAADQWGSQTEHISNGDMDPYTTGLADDWTKGHLGSNYSIVSSFGFTTGQQVDANGTARAWFLQESADMTVVPTAGKKYRLTFDYASGSGTGLLTVAQGISGVGTTISTFPNEATSTAAEVEFTADGIEDRLNFYNPGSSAFLVIDNVSIVEIGAVASYPQTNIPSPYDPAGYMWEDESDNSLDAIFSGATPILPDTWEDFYTDYSTLGYHAKTNSLIVMRDCTGHWSLGNDYGDAWLTDLDTLYHTTGRRIFTAGRAYTNWATDWNGDLIIGQQASNGTDVDILKWTDEPQSQAVGLIHIETQDIDFGNPAIIDIIDAFAATVQTDTGQTNPVRYSIDGTKTWTTITADFDTAALWAKYLAEPTAFNCNTIRVRITNPTNAGTLVINELIIRHEPQLLKLS